METITTIERRLPLLFALTIAALIAYFIVLAHLLFQSFADDSDFSAKYHEDAGKTEVSVEVLPFPEPYDCITAQAFCELALPANTFVEEGTEVCYGVFYDGSNYTLVFQDGKAVGYIQPCASLELLKQQKLETDEVVVEKLLAAFETTKTIEEEK